MKRITMTLIIAMMLAFAPVYANIDATDTENQNFTLSLAGQGTNSVTAVTAVQPLKAIDGHIALFVARQTAHDEVVSENIDAEIVARYKIIETFIESKRDLHRGIDWEGSIGYFLTPPPVKVGPFTVSAGAGNSTNDTRVKETLKIEGESTVQFNWISYLQLDFWKTQTTLTAEPSIDFEQVELELDSTIEYPVDENVSIGATFKAHFASDPPTGDKTHTQYLLFARWTR